MSDEQRSQPGCIGGQNGAVISGRALTAVWMLAAMVIALRQALDYTSLLRALAVCSIGWLLALVFVIVFGLLSGPALSAQSKPATGSQPSNAPTPPRITTSGRTP